MASLQSQDVVARSATTLPTPQIRTNAPQVAKLIDESKCIGCKACQVACMNWNDLRDDIGETVGDHAQRGPPVLRLDDARDRPLRRGDLLQQPHHRVAGEVSPGRHEDDTLTGDTAAHLRATGTATGAHRAPASR